jgi:hypothetical protein
MANSVFKTAQGTFWPVGNIAVPTPGTPVSLMSLVDSANTNAPETPTSTLTDEYTRGTCQEIFFQAYKAGAGPPRLTANTGNIYIVMKPLAGAGGVADTGNIIAVIPPGQSFTLSSAALNRNVFSPYEILVDADTAADGVQATLKIS